MIEHEGSGNVFFEMGFEDWKERTAKAEIVIEIASHVKGDPLAWYAAVAATGMAETAFRDLVIRGRADGFDVAGLEQIKAIVEEAVAEHVRKP